MNPDPNVVRATLKLLVALKCDPRADFDALVVRAANTFGISPAELRHYATQEMGLLVAAAKEEVVSVSEPSKAKGR